MFPYSSFDTLYSLHMHTLLKPIILIAVTVYILGFLSGRLTAPEPKMRLIAPAEKVMNARDFDKAFLEESIRINLANINLAKSVFTSARPKSPEVFDAATFIAEQEQKQIENLQGILKKLYGSEMLIKQNATATPVVPPKSY
jgi:hypothetical protein